jgi:ribokinase
MTVSKPDPCLLVVGSLNMDVVVTVPHVPQPGETVLGSDYALYPGGKGANQAVAAARAGSCPVQLVGCVGSDAFGAQLRAAIQASGVGDQALHTVSGSSGVALITVVTAADQQGQNSIVVSPGANAHLDPQRWQSLVTPDLWGAAGLLLLQLEIPLPTVIEAISRADQAGIPVMLNPAPFLPLDLSVLQQVSYLVLNQTEAESLSQRRIRDISSAQEAALHLQQQGIPTVIITLGGSGVIWADQAGIHHQPAFVVEVVDTTAAGDCFCGVLGSVLVAGGSLAAGIRFGAAAAALAVARVGAQPSLPWHHEIQRFLDAQNT